MGQMEIEVPEFTGPRKISTLGCYPLKYHKESEKLKQELIQRGKKFVELAGMKYKFHNGMAFYKKKRQVIKVNINSRVMVDPAIHRRINPNYPISTVKPADPDILDDEEDEDSDDESCNCESSSDEEGLNQKPGDQFVETDKPITKYKLIKDDDDDYHLVEIEVGAEGNAVQKKISTNFQVKTEYKSGSLQRKSSSLPALLCLDSPSVRSCGLSSQYPASIISIGMRVLTTRSCCQTIRRLSSKLWYNPIPLKEAATLMM